MEGDKRLADERLTDLIRSMKSKLKRTNIMQKRMMKRKKIDDSRQPLTPPPPPEQQKQQQQGRSLDGKPGKKKKKKKNKDSDASSVTTAVKEESSSSDEERGDESKRGGNFCNARDDKKLLKKFWKANSKSGKHAMKRDAVPGNDENNIENGLASWFCSDLIDLTSLAGTDAAAKLVSGSSDVIRSRHSTDPAAAGSEGLRDSTRDHCDVIPPYELSLTDDVMCSKRPIVRIERSDDRRQQEILKKHSSVEETSPLSECHSVETSTKQTPGIPDIQEFNPTRHNPGVISCKYSEDISFCDEINILSQYP